MTTKTCVVDGVKYDLVKQNPRDETNICKGCVAAGGSPINLTLCCKLDNCNPYGHEDDDIYIWVKAEEDNG